MHKLGAISIDMKNTFIIIFLVLTLFGCDTTNNSSKIKEIYYRDLSSHPHTKASGIDTIKFITEILFLFSDGQGIQFVDKRNLTSISDIVHDKMEEMKVLQDHQLINNGYFKIKKIPIDETNFMVNIINPTTSNHSFLYKCHFETTNKTLKTKYYMIENKDTLWLTYTVDDPGIYTFETFKKDSSLPNLSYPNMDKSSKNIIDTPSGL
jgi:hypothetical protein